MSGVRVRFAPSPTGYLHVGGARTAIFNWLFAKKMGGKFLLRIEDTDQERSGEEEVAVIFDALKWLGLHWDEEPVFQSTRIRLHHEFVETLIENGNAYYCYCSRDRLDEQRKKAQASGQTFRYDGHCRSLSEEEARRLEGAGTPRVVRFRVPDTGISFDDHVYGKLSFDGSEIGDFVIQKSDGFPTYHAAVVYDDHLMGITHVIRGEDHISNTPKQVLLYRAAGWELPEFAHVPLILGADKGRLSKRHGATSVLEYRERGYLSWPLVNFLALLGWSAGDDRELYSCEELIRAFDISGILRKGAVFDERKLEWMNGAYINDMPDEELLPMVCDELVAASLLESDEVSSRREYLLQVIGLTKTRYKRLEGVSGKISYFFTDPVEFEDRGVAKHWSDPVVAERLREYFLALDALSDFDAGSLEAVLRELAERSEVSAAKFIHPTRLAVSGVTVGPGLFEMLELLGREVVLRRLKKAIHLIESSG